MLSLSDSGRKTMLLGRIPEFDAHRDDWRIYIERLEQFFKANKIPTELQVPTLITVMGPASYGLLVNLCTPEMPSTKTFVDRSNRDRVCCVNVLNFEIADNFLMRTYRNMWMS